MRLIKETGEGLADATSYLDDIDVNNLLPYKQLGVWETLDVNDRIDCLVIASQYINNSFDWIGRQKTIEQGLCWPRLDVRYQGYLISENVIPKQIVRASILALQLLLMQGDDILQDLGEFDVKKEKIGSMETEYFERLKNDWGCNFDNINKLLRGFYIDGDAAVSKSNYAIADILRS